MDPPRRIDIRQRPWEARLYDVLDAGTGEPLDDLYYADMDEGLVAGYARDASGAFFLDETGRVATFTRRRPVRIVHRRDSPRTRQD